MPMLIFRAWATCDDSERNSMITRGLDYHSHNTRSKETIRSIRSNTNWGLLTQIRTHSALTHWNSLSEDITFVYLIMLLNFHHSKILNLNKFA